MALERFADVVERFTHGYGNGHLLEPRVETVTQWQEELERAVRRAENLEAYSRRVLMNAVFDHRKRRSGSEIVLAELPDRPGQAPETTELHVTLMGALATLPVRDQAIVVLRHWEDQSVDVVAEILDVSPSVVKMQSLRSLARLRELLGEDFALQD